MNGPASASPSPMPPASPAIRPQPSVRAGSEELFSPFARGSPEAPFVAAQLGQSLDGRIATVSGDSCYINGEAALDHLHRLRAHVDAVVVGAGTVAADDPQLTVRRVEGRSPARVVIDPNGRSPAGARWRKPDGARRIVIGLADGQASDGVELVAAASAAGGTLCPRAIIAALGRRGFARILIEGGARTVSAFMDAGLVDRLHLMVAPLIIGSGQAGLELAPIRRLKEALRPATRAHLLDDGDVLFDCDLRRLREA